MEERNPPPAEKLGAYLSGTLAPAEQACVEAALAQDPLLAEVVETWQQLEAEGPRPEEQLGPAELERGWRALVAELEADLPPPTTAVHPRLLRPVALYPVATWRGAEDAQNLPPAPTLARSRDERWLKLLLVDPGPLPAPLRLELHAAQAATTSPRWQQAGIELDDSRTLWLELPPGLPPGSYELRLVDPASGEAVARWRLAWSAS